MDVFNAENKYRQYYFHCAKESHRFFYPISRKIEFIEVYSVLNKRVNMKFLQSVVITPILLFTLYLMLNSYSTGIIGQAVAGCTCHSSIASASTTVNITGLPASGYTNGTVYPITVQVTNTIITPASPFGLRDGFDLLASAGSFTAITGTTLNGATEIRHNTPKAPVSGTASWTFNWTAPATGSAAITFNLAGNATNGNNNSSGDQWNKITLTLVKQLPLGVSAAITTPITCNGGTTTINATALNGVSPFQYQINGGAFQTISSFPLKPAGTYTVVAKDATNATASTILTVTQPAAITINSVLSNSPACVGGTNGSITMSASGGTGSKTYSISPLGPQTNTTGIFSTLSAQSYTVTVLDANSCSVTTQIIVSNPAPLIVTASNVSACAGHPVTLNGSPAGGTFSVANPYTGPSTTYTYTYTNGSGCSATSSPATITINPVSSSTIVNAAGGSVCETRNQLNGTLEYTNSNCELIGKINANSLGNTDFCAGFLPGFPTWNGEPYAGRVYSIVPTTQPASSASVCLYYTTTDLATAGISSNADISITKVGGNGILGGTGTVTEILNSSMIINSLAGGIREVCFPVTSFSSFYLHSKNLNNVPLPVDLIAWDVKENGHSDWIEWETGMEFQNNYFVVEVSMDGLHFNELAQIPSLAIHGNSVQHLTYQYTNGNPMPGLNYYRLKQVDIDGHCTYSEIKMVQHQQLSGSYHWFPNPSTGPIWMVADQPYDVRIYAVNGQLVGEWKGVQNQEFNLDTPGLYIINMYKNGILQSVQKLTIQK